MMVLCDRWGRVYDVWISFGSVHEVRAFRERKRRSLWFRKLVESIKMAAIWMSVSLGFLPAFGFGTLRNGKAFSRSFRICW